MKPARLSGVVSGLAAIAIAATMLAADSAQAAGALFRLQITYFGVFSPFSTTWPPTKGPGKLPPATGYVGVDATGAKRVLLPKGVIDAYSTYYCVPGQCFPGYPISGGFYSYQNGRGRFVRDNPYGPTATTTVRFPTTLNLPIPYGSGNPVTPTTTFSGRYDFSRGGSMMVTPNNRFSGSMQLLYGPNARFYQYITINYPFASRAYGSFINPTEWDETEPFDITSSGMVTRFRLTPLGANKATTPNGAYVTAKAYYLHTLVPWTTGMISGYQPLGTYLTRMTYTGYDNVTPNGVGGVLSLVRPRLVHTYLNNSDPNVPISTNFQALRTWQIKVMLQGAPEPGAMLLLGTGIATLAGLAYLRRR